MANVDKLKSDRKSIIRKHWGYLKANIVMKYISDPLIQDGVITPSDWMNMKQKHHISSDINEEFLYILYNEKIDYYPRFLKALRENGFPYVADVLEGIAQPDSTEDVNIGEKSHKKQMIDERLNMESLQKLIKEEGTMTRNGVKNLQTDVEKVKKTVKNVQFDMNEVKGDVKGVKHDMDGVKTDITGMRSEVRDEMKAEMKEAQLQMDRQMKSMMKDYKKQLESMIKEENDKQVDNITSALIDKRQTSERSMARMKLDMSRIESDRQHLLEKKESLEQELRETRGQLSDAKKKVDDIKSQTQIRKIIDDLEKNIEDRESENERLNKAIFKLKSEKNKLRHELDITKTENVRLQEAIAMLRKEMMHKNRGERESHYDTVDTAHTEYPPVAFSPRQKMPFTKSPRRLVPVAASFSPRRHGPGVQNRNAVPPIDRFDSKLGPGNVQRKN